MRTVADQRAKLIARHSLARDGLVSTEEEVSAPDAQHIDVWFVPDAARPRRCRGLLGRMTEHASMLEAFYTTPTLGRFRECIRKQLTWEHNLRLKNRRAEAPVLWIISSGRPRCAIASLGFEAVKEWPEGVYGLRHGWRAFLVVVSELPGGRDTLMVRLMGRGKVLKRAIRDLLDLPAYAPERRIEAEFFRLRGSLRDKMKRQRLTAEEKDFLSATRAYDEHIARVRQQARNKAVQAEVRRLQRSLREVYAGRFGVCPQQVDDAIETRRDPEVLARWIPIFATRTRGEISRELGVANPLPGDGASRSRSKATPKRTRTDGRARAGSTTGPRRRST